MVGSNGNLDLFSPTQYGTTLTCLQELIDRARASCLLSKRSGVRYFDDCVVGYLQIWAGEAQSGGFRSPILESQTLYFDGDCKPKPFNALPPEACLAGFYDWRGSPLSLLWTEGHDIRRSYTFTRFAVEPGSIDRSYKWYGSADAPLLVWDPEHRGIIRHASQLFGHWTFGGQRVAALDATGAGTIGRRWRDGYEALSTLDQNGDGEVSGPELAELGLWFDANRDGVSQPGEVKTLVETGVSRLFYTPDRTDDRGHIFASRGFERVVEGRPQIGGSVDWFVERADSKMELVSKIVTEASICPAHGQPIEEIPATSDSNHSAAIASGNLSGLWEWRMRDDGAFGGLEPKGYLSFSDSEDGQLKGHSYLETPFKKGHAVKGAITVKSLSGKRTGKDSYSFRIDTRNEAKTVLESTVTLRPDGMLEGETVVSQVEAGKPVNFSYAWTAVRK